MVNKIDKKNALKKLLNQKTLLEMSGGGDLDTTVVTNIPGVVTLNGTEINVAELLSIITGLNTEITEIRKILGGRDLSSKIAGLDESQIDRDTGLIDATALPNYLKNDSNLPVTTKELADADVIGYPLYIADQIIKSTGNNNPKLPTGMSPQRLKNDGLKLDYITDPDLDTISGLGSQENRGINRYITLYDLITNDDGHFLSSDVDFILNRFSSLAQFKHLPALEYLSTGMVGGNKSSNHSKKNRSRKIRK